MDIAIDIIKKRLADREAWIEDLEIDEHDEIGMSLILQNIKGLKKALSLLIPEVRLMKLKHGKAKKRLNLVKKCISKDLYISDAELDTHSRKQRIVDARFIMFRVYYDLFIIDYHGNIEAILIELGNFFDRDRNNVRHGIHKTHDLTDLDELSKAFIKKIKLENQL